MNNNKNNDFLNNNISQSKLNESFTQSDNNQSIKTNTEQINYETNQNEFNKTNYIFEKNKKINKEIDKKIDFLAIGGILFGIIFSFIIYDRSKCLIVTCAFIIFHMVLCNNYNEEYRNSLDKFWSRVSYHLVLLLIVPSMFCFPLSFFQPEFKTSFLWQLDYIIYPTFYYIVSYIPVIFNIIFMKQKKR